MYKKMEIEKVKGAKEEVERQIEGILKAFEEKTHTKIEDIEIVQRILYYGEERSKISGIKIDVRL